MSRGSLVNKLPLSVTTLYLLRLRVYIDQFSSSYSCVSGREFSFTILQQVVADYEKYDAIRYDIILTCTQKLTKSPIINLAHGTKKRGNKKNKNDNVSL